MSQGQDSKPVISIDDQGIMNLKTPFGFNNSNDSDSLNVLMPVVGGVGISSDVTCQGSIAQFNFWRSVDHLKMLPISRLKLLYSGLSAGTDLDSYSDTSSDSESESDSDSDSESEPGSDYAIEADSDGVLYNFFNMAQNLAGIEVSDSDVELEPQTAPQISSELDPENDLGSFFSMAERFADPDFDQGLYSFFLGIENLTKIQKSQRDSSKLAEIYNHPINANMFRFLLSTDHDDHILRFNGDKAWQRALFSVTRGSKEPIRDAAGNIIRWPACSDSGLGFVLRSVLSGISNINLNKMTGFIDNSTIQKLKIKQHFNSNFVTSTTDGGFNSGSDSDDDIDIETCDTILSITSDTW